LQLELIGNVWKARKQQQRQRNAFTLQTKYQSTKMKAQNETQTSISHWDH